MTCGCGGSCQQLGLRRAELQQLDGVLRGLTSRERRAAVANVIRRFPPHQRDEAAAWMHRILEAARRHPARSIHAGQAARGLAVDHAIRQLERSGVRVPHVRRGRRGHAFAGDLAELACTGKYNNLVVAGAADIKKPCAGMLGVELYCNQSDTDAWHIQADNLFDKYRQSWNATVKVVDARGTLIPDSVRQYATSIERDYCTADENWNCTEYLLPTGSWWNVNENNRDVQALVKFCQKCACILELLDTVREGKFQEGSTMPVEAPVKQDPGLVDLPGVTFDFKKILMYGGLGLAALLVLMAVRR